MLLRILTNHCLMHMCCYRTFIPRLGSCSSAPHDGLVSVLIGCLVSTSLWSLTALWHFLVSLSIFKIWKLTDNVFSFLYFGFNKTYCLSKMNKVYKLCKLYYIHRFSWWRHWAGYLVSYAPVRHVPMGGAAIGWAGEPNDICWACLGVLISGSRSSFGNWR